MVRSTLGRTALLLTAGLLLASPGVAEEATPAPPAAPSLRLARAEVGSTVPGQAGQPVAQVAADTLYQLRVVLENDGATPVSGFHFAVEIDGVALPVYLRQTFMALAPAGGSTELRLYNFWSTETARPALKGDKLTLVVILDEAFRTAVGSEADGTEVWTLGEAVGGLPQTLRLELPVAKP